MKLFLLVSLCVISTLSVRVPNSAYNEHWETFKTTYNKNYESYPEEAMRRFIFEDNHQFIESHNRRTDVDFSLGVNQFADLSNREFRKRFNGYRPPKNVVSKPDFVFEGAEGDTDVPDSIDWRDKGYVTEIKDQGQCGSCWAFSAVGSLEGQHFKKEGKLVSLSEQNLVDCSASEGNNGCQGGWMDQAYEYVKDNKGIDTEDGYPYTGVDGKCSYSANSIGATLTGFADVKHGDENALKEAVGTVGPVAVAIDASSMFFQFYRGGVYNVPWCSTTDLDHGVLVVGYGNFRGKDHWMVKNSWGQGWGIYGFIMMSRNKDNQCGIATNASYPLV